MCGIAGVVSWAEAPRADDVERMASTLVHRGPDDAGIFVDGPCGLGFRRLSILDIAGGHQPMTVEHATVVFNGEIYNHRELALELERGGTVLRGHSDTEVLVRAYLAWGREFVQRLDGMFAFALWDTRDQVLICARDRFGKKPFYFFHRSDVFLFGSELKALLAHPRCPREVDPVAVRRYLSFEYVPTPDGILSGVKKLEEGTQLLVDRRGIHPRRYYRPTPPRASTGLATLRGIGVGDATRTVRSELERAVVRRLFADVPVGIFLSGGLDSTIVAGLAARNSAAVQTFSISFAEDAFDESTYARAVARTLGTQHHEARLDAAEALKVVEDMREQLDEPFADPSYVPTFLLSRFTREHVKVALGGDGADELFLGYDTFLAHHPARVAEALPSWVVEAARSATRRLTPGDGYMTPLFKAQRFLGGLSVPPELRHQAWIGGGPGQVEPLLGPALRRGDAEAELLEPLRRLGAGGDPRHLAWAQLFYFSYYLRDGILVKVDRASMAASLEVRSPFLDTRVVELAFSLPLLLKLRGLTRKWVLREAFADLVPREVLARKKHGFAIPLTAWLRGPLRSLMEDTLAPRALADSGWLDVKQVRRLVDEHLSGRADHRKMLWTLIQLERWRTRWIKGGAVTRVSGRETARVESR